MSSLQCNTTCVGPIFCRKVITLLSFQIFHRKQIMMPSNLFLCAISNSIQHLGYQLYIDLGMLIVFSTKTKCCFMSFHTSFMNEKSLHRCARVPCSMPWSLHIWSCYLLWLFRLMVVRFFLCWRVHAKNDTWVYFSNSKYA